MGLLLVFLGCLSIIVGGYSYQAQTPIEKITAQYRKNMQELETSLAVLNNQALQLASGKSTQKKIQAQLLLVRKQYKTVEYLLDYLDGQSVKLFINGAPLPKIEPNTPDLRIMPPTGLQVLDEMAFTDDIGTAGLFTETAALLANFKRVNEFQQIVKISERNLFEAARFHLIRVAAMGITGFDTPGSGHALTDAQNSLQPLLKMVYDYHGQLDATIETQLLDKLNGAIEYLTKNTDFDSFNRFEFIKEYINPAFKLFKDAQLQLGIETVYETTGFRQSFNFLSDNIFAPNFLNPEYFSQTYNSSSNPDKAKLGKLLFYDPVLSSNIKRSCASCHNPALAFTDGQAKSTAMDFEGTVSRNAPTLINSVFADRYFYDLRVQKIENQFEHVITSTKEFNTSYPEIAGKLAKSSEYRALFATAFPEFNGLISKESVSEAIGAYIKTLTALNSPFDKSIRGESKQLTPSEINGFNLFMGKAVCATCHFPPTFSGLVPPYYYENESEVLGVPSTKDTLNAVLDPDIGRIGGRMLEKVDFNKFAFKTMTVRNSALTAPYMHNGVYTTLEEVVDFYNKGGGQGLGIYLENQTLPFDKLNLTESEKSDIVAFMKTLTDTAGLTSIPQKLPTFDAQPEWNKRLVGGDY